MRTVRKVGGIVVMILMGIAAVLVFWERSE